MRRPDNSPRRHEALPADADVGQVPPDDAVRLDDRLALQHDILRPTQHRVLAHLVPGLLQEDTARSAPRATAHAKRQGQSGESVAARYPSQPAGRRCRRAAVGWMCAAKRRSPRRTLDPHKHRGAPAPAHARKLAQPQRRSKQLRADAEQLAEAGAAALGRRVHGAVHAREGLGVRHSLNAIREYGIRRRRTAHCARSRTYCLDVVGPVIVGRFHLHRVPVSGHGDGGSGGGVTASAHRRR